MRFIRKTFITLGYFLLSFSSVYSTENRYYPFRAIHEPIIELDDRTKVTVLSAERTGSSFMYMLLQYLFEDTFGRPNDFSKKVVKTHSIKKWAEKEEANKSITIVTIRNPLECFISKIKILNSLKLYQENDFFLDQLLVAHIKEHMNFWHLIHSPENENLLILKYENFSKDIFDTLEKIEIHIGICISEETKREIKSLFSKSSLKKKYKHLKTHYERDPITNIHGSHISDEITLTEFVSSRALKKIYETLSPICNLYNYYISFSEQTHD